MPSKDITRAYGRRRLPRPLRREVLQRAGGKCEKCGRTERVSLNHIVAIHDGGGDDISNLSALCSMCHSEWHLLEQTHNVDYLTWLAAPPLGALYDRHAAAAGTPGPVPRDKLLGRTAHRPWGRPPITVDVDDYGRRTWSYEGLEIVDTIYRLRHEGLPMRSIAQRLNEMGKRTKTGRRWGSSAISHILNHPRTYYRPDNVDEPSPDPPAPPPPPEPRVVQLTFITDEEDQSA